MNKRKRICYQVLGLSPMWRIPRESRWVISLMIILAGLVSSVKSQHMTTEPFPVKNQAQLEKAFEYRNVGPSRGGRVTAVRGVEDHPGIFYMGSTGGGLWKTKDFGHHWNNVSDGYFASPSIGAIAIWQKNPDILYVGTGSDGIRSNVIVGKGIYKSTDGGVSWEFSGLEEAGQIGAIEIHPANPNLAYAAVIGQPFRNSTERGVYRTEDGGASWQQVLSHSDSIGAVDLELAPGNPEIIYAALWRAERKPWTIISGSAEDGIYKSVDGGSSWRKLTSGLPDGLVGKIDFAVSPSNPARVWAQIQATHGQEGLYRSDDFGENWQKVSMPANVHESVMYRPFYFTNLTANPLDADQIWAGTKAFWTSRNGGKDWNRVPTTHSDHHDLWIHPGDSLLMIEGNDGGASISRDGGQNWSSLFNQPTAELYSCYVDDQVPYFLYSGQQDNSAIRVPSRRPHRDVLDSNDNHGLNDMMYWEDTGGCETGPAIPKPGNPDIIYANCKGQFTVYNKKTGYEQNFYIGAESLYGNHPDSITYRFQRVTPMEVSPHDPEKVYYGSQYVHMTKDGGKSWETISQDLTANDPKYRMRSGGPIDEDISGEEYYAVLYAIEESPKREGVIWTGSNDGLFFVTANGGRSWENITPDMPDGGRVSNIEASPHHPGKAYYAVNRDYLGDDRPYIFGTGDYGKSWRNLSRPDNGIPEDHPVRVVREDPVREGLLYAGTEFGIYISFDDGINWRSFQQNLPVTPVTDLRIHRDDLVLSTLGRSFWVMEDISPLRQLENDGGDFILYKPRDTYRDQLNIYFSLPKPAGDSNFTVNFYRGDLKIGEIRDSLINHPENQWGIRRISWDLSHDLPNVDGIRLPRVSPAIYRVEMSHAEVIKMASFRVVHNPELGLSGTSVNDLIEQENLSMEIVSLLNQVKQEIDMLSNKRQEAKSASKKMDLSHKISLLQKGPRRYDKPMLVDHIEYLYEMVSSAPQKPGKDAYERLEELRRQFLKYKSGS